MEYNFSGLILVAEELKKAPLRQKFSNQWTLLDARRMIANKMANDVVLLTSEEIGIIKYLLPKLNDLETGFGQIVDFPIRNYVELLEDEPIASQNTNLRVSIVKSYLAMSRSSILEKRPENAFMVIAEAVKINFERSQKKLNLAQARLLSLDSRTLKYLDDATYCAMQTHIHRKTYGDELSAAIQIWDVMYQERDYNLHRGQQSVFDEQMILQRLFFVATPAFSDAREESILFLSHLNGYRLKQKVFGNKYLVTLLLDFCDNLQAHPESYNFVQNLRILWSPRCVSMTTSDALLKWFMKTHIQYLLNSKETYIQGLRLNYHEKSVLVGLYEEEEKNRLWEFVLEKYDMKGAILMARNCLPKPTQKHDYSMQRYGRVITGLDDLIGGDKDPDHLVCIVNKFEEKGLRFIWSPLEHLVKTEWTWKDLKNFRWFMMWMSKCCGARVFGGERGVNREMVPNWIAYSQDATRVSLRLIRLILTPDWVSELDQDLLGDVVRLFKKRCPEIIARKKNAFESPEDRSVRLMLTKLVHVLIFSLQECDEVEDQIFINLAAPCVEHLIFIDPKLAMMLSVALNRSLLKLNFYQQQEKPEPRRYTCYHWDDDFNHAQKKIEEIFPNHIESILQGLYLFELKNPYVFEVPIMSIVAESNLVNSEEFCNWMIIREKLQAPERNHDRVQRVVFVD